MTDIQKFRQRDRRPCYFIRVAGVDTLFGTHTPPDITDHYGVTYGKRAMMVPDGLSFSRRYEENTRVVSVDNINITLVSNDLNSSDVRDPGRVFGRIGYHGATQHTKVTDSVEHDDTDITVESSANFSIDDIVHLGLETMQVTAKPNATTITVTRGILGTFPRFHRVDTASGSYPFLTMPLTYFRGRRVIVYEGIVDEAGGVSSNLSDYIQVFRGFFASEPQTAVSGRSHQITLELAPMTAILDKPLPASSLKTFLHPQLHAFDGQGANIIDVVSFAKEGGLFDADGDAETYGGNANRVRFRIPEIESASGRFALDLADFHPRSLTFPNIVDVEGVSHGRFAITSSMIGSSADNSYAIIELYPESKWDANNNQLEFRLHYRLTQLMGAATRNVRFTSRKMQEMKRLYLTTTGTRTSPDVKVWTTALVEAFETYLSSSSIAAADGFLFNVEIEPAVGLLYVKPNYSYGVGPDATAFFTIANSQEAMLNVLLENGFTMDDRGISESLPVRPFADAATGNLPDSEFWNYFVSTEPYPESRLEQMSSSSEGIPKAALDLCVEDGFDAQVAEMTVTSVAESASPATLRAKVCRAFYHMGNQFTDPAVYREPVEKFIVLQGSMGVAAGSTMTVKAERGDGEVIAILEVKNETQVTVDGFVGYRYEVERLAKLQDVDCLVDMPGEERISFTPTILPTGLSIGDLIIKMLCSLNGNKITSSHNDTLSFGAGLSDGTSYNHTDSFGADVRSTTFTSIQQPLQAQTFKPVYEEGDTLLNAIEGLLASVGYTVDIRTRFDGLCELQAVELSLPNASDIARNFTESDIADSPTPTSEAELSIKNVFNFKLNHDMDGEPGVEVSVKDQVSIDLFNEAQELELDLKGVSVDDASPGDVINELRPMFSKLRVENSYPRRIFTFEVPTGELHGLALGDTCTVTHSLLRSQGGMGVTSEPARVRSIEFDGYAPTGRIELVSYGVVGSSWSPTLGVVRIMPNTQDKVLKVRVRDHTPSRRPSTGETLKDLNGFVAGDPVDIYSLDDMDSPAQTNEVKGVDLANSTIELLNPATGLFGSLDYGTGVVGYIQGVSLSAASNSSHKIYGYIGATVST